MTSLDSIELDDSRFYGGKVIRASLDKSVPPRVSFGSDADDDIRFAGGRSFADFLKVPVEVRYGSGELALIPPSEVDVDSIYCYGINDPNQMD